MTTWTAIALAAVCLAWLAAICVVTAAIGAALPGDDDGPEGRPRSPYEWDDQP